MSPSCFTVIHVLNPIDNLYITVIDEHRLVSLVSFIGLPLQVAQFAVWPQGSANLIFLRSRDFRVCEPVKRRKVINDKVVGLSGLVSDQNLQITPNPVNMMEVWTDHLTHPYTCEKR